MIERCSLCRITAVTDICDSVKCITYAALGYVPSPFNQLLTFHGSCEVTESAIRYCKNVTFDLADNVN